MFVAKFTQTTGSPFIADKNSQMPFIGTVLAGSAKSTLINGTMFQREGLIANKMYACENVEETYEGKVQNKVLVLGLVELVEFQALRVQLGSPVQPKANTSEVKETVAVVTPASPF
jgi:hypothetical protein